MVRYIYYNCIQFVSVLQIEEAIYFIASFAEIRNQINSAIQLTTRVEPLEFAMEAACCSLIQTNTIHCSYGSICVVYH